MAKLMPWHFNQESSGAVRVYEQRIDKVKLLLMNLRTLKNAYEKDIDWHTVNEVGETGIMERYDWKRMGICSLVNSPLVHTEDSFDLCPIFSALNLSSVYPVKAPWWWFCKNKEAFNKTRKYWEGRYGKNRYNLLCEIIHYLEENPDAKI